MVSRKKMCPISVFAGGLLLSLASASASASTYAYECSILQSGTGYPQETRTEKSYLEVSTFGIFHSPRIVFYLWGRDSKIDPVTLPLASLADSQERPGYKTISTDGFLSPRVRYDFENGILSGAPSGKVYIVEYHSNFETSYNFNYDLTCTRSD